MNSNIKDELLAQAQLFIQQQHVGVLATIEQHGYPYASLVELAPLENGDILLLLSNLAAHTKNLRRNNHCSLFLGDSIMGQPAKERLAKHRVTLIGTIRELPDKAAMRAGYLEVHPHAGSYVDFSDFHFYRMYVERIRTIEGFGRMGWLNIER